METLFSFTNAKLSKIINDTSKRIQLRDSVQKGLMFRCSPANKKTFYYRGWDNLKKRTVIEKIGDYPAISIAQARNRVQERSYQVSQGIDLTQERIKQRQEKTIDDIFSIWFEDYAKVHLSNHKDIYSRHHNYISPYLGDKTANELTSDILKEWQTSLLKQPKKRQSKTPGVDTLSKGTAGRAKLQLSSMYTNTLPHLPNPCKGVKTYTSQPRDVFLQSHDLERFFEALDHPDTPETLKIYWMVCICTGVRVSRVRAMRWEDIDFKLQAWRISAADQKNLQAMLIPLPKVLWEVLEARYNYFTAIDKLEPWVFPNPKTATGHIGDPRQQWKAFLERAGLTATSTNGSHIKPHDLRRTFGSWHTIGGASERMLQAALGNRTEKSVKHYAHLGINPLREATERTVNTMIGKEKKD